MRVRASTRSRTPFQNAVFKLSMTARSRVVRKLRTLLGGKDEATTMRMTAEQAAQSGDDGYWVLNGAADGPATRILQDRSGADVRVKTRQQAQEALAQAGYHYPEVELEQHEFPDAAAGHPHKTKVWVPGNRIQA